MKKLVLTVAVIAIALAFWSRIQVAAEEKNMMNENMMAGDGNMMMNNWETNMMNMMNMVNEEPAK